MSYVLSGIGSYAGFGAADLSVITTVLRQGSSGPAVQAWDEFLGVPPAPPSFPFGPKTFAATVAFQKAHGLTADGVVGAATLAAAKAAQAGGGGGAPASAPPGELPGMTPGGGMIVPAGGGGGGAVAPVPSVSPSGSPIDKAKAWWAAQPNTTHYAIMGGAGVLVLGLVFLAMSGGKKKPVTAKPNRRLSQRDKSDMMIIGQMEKRIPVHFDPLTGKRLSERRLKSLKKRAATSYLLATHSFSMNRSRKRRPKYRANRSRRACAPMKAKVRTCHCTPPKKYRRKGATARSDYAFPECYMYPIRFRKKGKVQHQLTAKHIRAAASRIGKFGRRYPPAVRKRIKGRIQAAERQYGIGRR